MTRPYWEGDRRTRIIEKKLGFRFVDGKLRLPERVLMRQKTVVRSMGLVNYLEWEDDKVVTHDTTS